MQQAEGVIQNSHARDRLLMRAANLFMELGYERTTMRNIAAAAGIKLGSIAYYFRSKDEILFETMKAVIEAGERRAFSAVQNARNTEDKLRALIETEVHSFINGTGAIVIKEWRGLPEEHKAALLDRYKAYQGLWIQVLEECHEKRLIRCRPEIARQFIRGAFAWAETWYKPEGELKLDELVDEMMRLIVQEVPATRSRVRRV
jgi:TetR/AcrR family transcriptional regulator, cholesterol catabolism regulator